MSAFKLCRSNKYGGPRGTATGDDMYCVKRSKHEDRKLDSALKRLGDQGMDYWSVRRRAKKRLLASWILRNIAKFENEPDPIVIWDCLETVMT